MIEKNYCTGCSACSNICPAGCISMQEDSEGFQYPVKDTSKCLNCNLCEKVCPIQHMPPLSSNTFTISAQNYDEAVRAVSSAGGIASSLYKYTLYKGGAVFGAGFDGVYVKHMIAETENEVMEKQLLCSKYVASDLGDIFKQVKNKLNEGREVCFIGLPCQVAGLKAYLQKQYSNLLLVDLVCYGVPSAKVYRKYIDYCKETYKKNVTSVRFRDKTFGYAAPSMCITLENGAVKSQNGIVKSYLRTFFSHLSIRPSCFNCSFKTLERVSDITIGDFKSVGKFIPEFDDDLGTTVVYIHSEKGKSVIKELNSDIKIAEVGVEDVLKTSGKKVLECANKNPKRDLFFSEIDTRTYKDLIDRYCPETIDERVASAGKWILKKTGLNKTKLLKRIKSR